MMKRNKIEKEMNKVNVELLITISNNPSHRGNWASTLKQSLNWLRTAKLYKVGGELWNYIVAGH